MPSKAGRYAADSISAGLLRSAPIGPTGHSTDRQRRLRCGQAGPRRGSGRTLGPRPEWCKGSDSEKGPRPAPISSSSRALHDREGRVDAKGQQEDIKPEDQGTEHFSKRSFATIRSATRFLNSRPCLSNSPGEFTKTRSPRQNHLSKVLCGAIVEE